MHSAELATDDCALLKALGLTDRCLLRVCKAGEPCIVEVKAHADRACRAPRPRRVRRPRSDRLTGRFSGYRIALVGNPNTGKTTLFNRLSGARAKTSNFLGTTTAARIGRATLANGAAPVEAEIVDLPGLYRLGLSTPESTICREVLAGQGCAHKPDAVVVVVDARNLTRNLVLVGELLRLRRAGRRRAEHGRPRPAARADAERRGAVEGDRLPGGADRRPPRRGRRSADVDRRRRAEAAAGRTRRSASTAIRRSRRGPTRRSRPASPASARAATA